jgi:hypothetical protein
MSLQASERELRTYARAQHSVFSLAQALASGYSRATVRRRVETKVWEELAPRAYRAALGTDADWRARTMALVLSTGGIACRRSALALFGLCAPPPRPELLVVRNARTAARLPQLSTDRLPEVDMTCRDGIPVTTAARTLLDIGGRLPLARFEDVLDNAIVQRLVTCGSWRSEPTRCGRRAAMGVRSSWPSWRSAIPS